MIITDNTRNGKKRNFDRIIIRVLFRYLWVKLVLWGGMVNDTLDSCRQIF